MIQQLYHIFLRYNCIMISQSSIESLKSSIDIVDLISNYIELKKAGANFKARCPFHGEKTPSFVVSPQKQIFHCFGCGIGGDAIKFVMEYEKLGYKDAIEKLASMYNIRLSYEKGSASFVEAKRVLELLEHWYRENLFKYKFALDYLKERGISQKSIERFGLGYVDSSSSVLEFLKSSQLPLPKAVEAGVIAIGDDKRYYARLTNRVIFPIYNQAGAIIGFGGRTLSNHPAKYINSPQTKLFDKSRVLYGYNLAKNEIYNRGEIIITEGYLDVIMLHQAGFSNAVATLGTALTTHHLPLIKKTNAKVVLAYDGDKAGINAAFKASFMLSQSGYEGRVVIFPNGKDPADMVAQNSLNELKEYLSGGLDLGVFVIEQIKSKYNLNNPHQKSLAINEVKSYLNGLDGVIKDSYIIEASRRFNVDTAYFKTKQKSSVSVSQIKRDPVWESMLKSMANNKNLIDLALDVIDFSFAKGYENSFRALAKEDFEEPILRGILIDDKIKVLNEDEFKKQLIKELIIYYNSLLKKVSSSNLDYNKKSYIIRKIKSDIIPRLKKGELVVYESFGII